MRYAFAAAAAIPLALASPVLINRDAAVAGKYLVVLKPGSATGSTDKALQGVAGGLISSIAKDHVYDHGSFKGFAGALNSQQLDALRADPSVAYVEPDGIAHTQQEDNSVQSGATWGLGRISHRAKGSTDYLYDASAGAGTCSYIVDTGILVTHPELEGRATFVKSYTGVNTDDNGHGSHVAGTIGSKTYGVAKKTKLYAIKVLDAGGSGSWSDIISGIGLVVTDSKKRSCPNGVVVNMSLGGDKSQAVNDAVAAAVDAGVFFAVAAGNEATDFSTTSPASEPKAFAVGATDVNDAMAYFSNYGTTLGVFAPGVDVLSIWKDGKTNTISGTSMASPHVAGLGAYLLGLNGPSTPAQIGAQIKSLATTGSVAITGAGTESTPNRLAFNGGSGSSGDADEPEEADEEEEE